MFKIFRFFMGARRHNSIWVRIIFESPELVSDIINGVKNKIRAWKLKLAYRLLDES